MQFTKKASIALEQLAEDTRSFTYPLNTVEKIDAKDITPCEFYRKYISLNRPCIIKNAFNHWPALEKWENYEYLINACGEEEFSVNITPDGYGDALCEIQGKSRKGSTTRKVFVKPLEEKITMKKFMQSLKKNDFNNIENENVLYCSRQNSSLTDEFSVLIKDIELDLSFAKCSLENKNTSDAVSKKSKAEAINLWIGDDRSISTTHQDPYENFYTVIKGTKIFTLYPPSDVGYLYEKMYPTASYVRDENNKLCIQLDESNTTIPWIAMDKRQSLDEIADNFPKFKFAHEVTATVEKGECLYLPALWFHHVQQRGLTIAVNYWYDFTFDYKFSFYNFVRTNSGLLPYGEIVANDLKHTIIFDFDWTMVNENTDTWVFQQLSPDLYNELMQMRKDDTSGNKLSWQDLMNHGLKKLASKYNCGREELKSALNAIPIFPEIFRMIRIMHQQGHEIIVLSDANEFYIDCILKKHKINYAIKQIITNKSDWVPSSSSQSKDTLQIKAYHSKGGHDCSLCPQNLCKGKVLQQLRDENYRRYKKFFYVGDGGGDFCPYTQLNQDDYFYARENYSCHRKIEKWNKKCPVWPKPNVRIWRDDKDVAGYLQNDLQIATSIDQCSEDMLQIGEKTNAVSGKHSHIKLWYRTWGNKANGIPVLFVHGGPGNCVDDYQNINSKFFNKNNFYVVEVDQRGTGRSTPSVRDDYNNIQYYLDISIEQMSDDFELIRKHLKIDRWLVFGGSWGSTLGLDYAERYPAKCLGLIIRGIYLNTKEEFDAIYCRKSFENNPRRLKEFDVFFELAKEQVNNLDPNDSEQFIRVYEKMIINGNRDFAWRFYVFENNLMEEDPEELLDPYKISEKMYPEALSVSFFESRLFLKGTFENPEQLNLLGRVKELKNGFHGNPVKTWVVQGVGDEVCPEIFAKQLVNELESSGIPFVDHFVDAGHKASSDAIGSALIECVNDFFNEIKA
eukprot:g1363.t1